MTQTSTTVQAPASTDSTVDTTRRHYVFAYGSLSNPLRAEAIVGRECQASFPELGNIERVSARASHFRREGGLLPHAVQDAAGTIDGYILGPLTDDEIAKLDRYEDAPQLFVRDVCWAAVEGLPAGLACWIYVGKTITRATPGD